MRKIVFIAKFAAAVLFLALLFNTCKSNNRRYSSDDKQNFEENLVKANKGLVTKYQEDIANYVTQRKWNMQKTETGLWYELVKEGHGKKAMPGMIAQLRFEVDLLDGTICYTSDSLGVKTFKIGQGGVESGLEEGILMLSEGDAARFIMPPHLAHGLLGDENKIPSRSIIVYNVELLKLTDY